MKKYILASALMLMVILCQGQSYIAYTINGDVTVKSGAKASAIVPGKTLTDKSVISIPDGGRLAVVCESDNTMRMLKVAGTGTLSSLFSKQGNTIKAVTGSYVAFVKEKVNSGNKIKDVNYMQSAGTSYRGIGTASSKPLPKAEPGMLLQPLRDACAKAKKAIENNDVEGLLAAADDLESLGLCRYAFNVAGYEPNSFNGYLVYDPLCLRDLAANLSGPESFAEQVKSLPVPMASEFNDTTTSGNILCNYYVLQPGQTITLSIDCEGYCEFVALDDAEIKISKVNSTNSINTTYCNVLESHNTLEVVCTATGDETTVVMVAVNR